jgi:hypothetical protein
MVSALHFLSVEYENGGFQILIFNLEVGSLMDFTLIIIYQLFQATLTLIASWNSPMMQGRNGIKLAFVILLITATSYASISTHNADLENKNLSAKLAAEVKKNTGKLNEVGASLITIEKLVDRGALIGAAEAATLKDIDESDKADKCFQSGKAASDTTIRYYLKDVDGKIISIAFKKLGFKSEEIPSDLSNESTNAIWFDRDVPIDDVKLVACILIRAGLKIQTIKPFQSGEKPKTIEVGTDQDYFDFPVLKVNPILRSSKFERT